MRIVISLGGEVNRIEFDYCFLLMAMNYIESCFGYTLRWISSC